MSFTTCLILLVLLAMPASAPAQEQPMEIKTRLAAAAKYEVPQGWAEELSVEQGDPQALISLGGHEITVRLSGGKGSRYKTAGDFLAGFEARSKGGTAAEKTGYVAVSGMNIMLYRREVVVSGPPPETGGPYFYAPEEFCVLPAGNMFFVLSYSYPRFPPDPDYNGLQVWRKFLKEFRAL